MGQAAKEEAKGITKRLAELECGATPSTKRVSNFFDQLKLCRGMEQWRVLMITLIKLQPRGSGTLSTKLKVKLEKADACQSGGF